MGKFGAPFSTTVRGFERKRSVGAWLGMNTDQSVVQLRVGGKGLVDLTFVRIRQGGGSAETEAEVGHRGNVPVTEVLIEGSSVLEGPVKRGQGRKVPSIQGLVEGSRPAKGFVGAGERGSVPVADGLVEGGGSVEGVAHGGE